MNKVPYFDIQISDSCNLHCKHCCMKNAITNKNEVNFENIKNYLREQPFVKEVHLAGGEPLLNNSLDIINLINEFPDIHWKMTSNLCFPLTKERIEVIKKVYSIQTSFDVNIRFGNIKNLLMWYRNCKYILKNIRKDLEVFTIITKYLIKKDPFKLMNFYVSKMGFKGYKYVILMNAGSYNDNKDIGVTKEEYVEFMNRVLDTKDVVHNNTIILLLEKNMTNCFFGSECQPLDIYGREQFCGIKEKSNGCNRVAEECLTCKYYSNCGGRCVLVPCMYDDNLYKRIKNESIDLIRIYHDLMY